MKCHICNAVPHGTGELSVEPIHTIDELEELRKRMGGVIKIGEFAGEWIIENSEGKRNGKDTASGEK